MRKKNGFVLFETLTVVLLLTVSLMSLYATFSTIVSRIKEKNNSDTIDTVYKTYFIRDLLDSSYANDENAPTDYNDSFLYYYDKVKGSNFCNAYSYSSGEIPETSSNSMIICDYSNFETSGNLYENDILYKAATIYHIEKIYYVNFSKLFTNNKNVYNKLFNRFDASSIDYMLQQDKTVDGSYVVVKFYKPYYDVNTTDEMDEDFKIMKEKYHSKIIMNEKSVSRKAVSYPITFYDKAGTDNDSFDSPESYENGEAYIVTSAHSFTKNNHSGQVIVGWTTDSTGTVVYDQETFNSCVNNPSNYDVFCYPVNKEITLNAENRNLYAIWCGNGSLEGALSCLSNKYEGEESSINVTNGLSYNENTNLYRYVGDGGNNYVALGNYCYRLVSNFGSTTGIKAIYSGPLSSENKCIDANSLNSTTSAYNKTNWYGGSYMFKNKVSVQKIGSVNDFGVKVGLHQGFSKHVKTNELFGYNDDVYVSKKVSYKDGKYTLVDSKGNTVTEKKTYYGLELTGYQTINSDFGYSYVCKDGVVSCSEVYFISSVWKGSDSKYYVSYYKYTGGLTHDDVVNAKIVMGRSVTYKDGKYTLNDTKTFTIGQLTTMNSNYDTYSWGKRYKYDIYNYRYMCDNPLESNGTTCTSVDLLYALTGYGAYVKLENGLITDDDLREYTIGKNASELTIDSNAKTLLDNFYKTNYAGKEAENFIDKNTTYCNSQKIIGKGYTPNSVSNWPGTWNSFQSYFSSSKAASHYADCDDNVYLYSTSDASSGNHMLKYPIGLLTRSEVETMGLKYNVIYTDNYLLNTGMLMSPSQEITHESNSVPMSRIFAVTSQKLDYQLNVKDAANIKPVIGVKFSNKIKSGDGSKSNPYIFQK